MTKAFLRMHRARHHATAILFVDLEAAFYKVVRPLALSGTWDDEIIASMANSLKMPADTLHALHQHLQQPGATELAGMDAHGQRALQALHMDTHFQVPQQADAVKTHLGTRPGDAYADVVFGYLMARLLKYFEAQLASQDILSHMHSQNGPVLFGRVPDTAPEAQTFIGPVWMDDLAVCLWGEDCHALNRKVGLATSLLLDSFREHAMSPNLSKGKTELVFSLRGKGMREWQQKLHGPTSSGYYVVIGEAESYQVPIVTSYVHLGSLIHHSGGTKQEARRRIAIANGCFNRHAKLIFQNQQLALPKRVELFSSLVLSKLTYGSETWVLTDWQTRDHVHAAIIRLYRRILHRSRDAHLSDDDILCTLGLPTPTELLRRNRLRYLATLLQTGMNANWGLLNQDTDWLNLLQDDFQWLWRNLHNSCDLGDPTQHIERWLEIAQYHPGYWKRLVKRACIHAQQQRLKEYRCCQFYANIQEILHDHDLALPLPPSPQPTQVPEDAICFGCMCCQTSFRSSGGEGAHMFRKHKQVHPVRFLFDSTQCSACLREYFTHGKMKMHLIRSEACRSYLLKHGGRHHPVSGLGSRLDQHRHVAHDNKLPPQQAQGPLKRLDRPREVSRVHWALHDAIAEQLFLCESSSELEPCIRDLIQATEVSWTQCVHTLRELSQTARAETEPLGVFHPVDVTRCLCHLMCSSAWPFLHQRDGRPCRTTLRLHDWEQACERFTIRIAARAPRPVGAHRVILHAYSGRRRAGDLQFYLEALHRDAPDGMLLHVVSLDLMTDPLWGDATRPETQRFWRNGADSGFVHGFLAGPPCETWSQARFVVLAETTHGPRPVRAADQLWGLDALSLRELHQVMVGNDLLGFALDMLLRVYFSGGSGIIEHPEMPADPAKPSIWRLPIMHVFRHLDGFQEVSFSQGLLGAASPKPTRLLTLNLPDLRSSLRAHHLTGTLPMRSAIGKQTDGTFRTGYLKEYPPAMSRALAIEFMRFLRSSQFDHSQTVDSAFLAKCQEMDVQHFSSRIGSDFAS